MKDLVDCKTYTPEHQAPTHISEVIAALSRFMEAYGDLPLELCTSPKQGEVMNYQDIFYAYNTYDDGTKNLSIQSFPY